MPPNYRHAPRSISNRSAMRVLFALALLVSHAGVAQAESEPTSGAQEPSWELALSRGAGNRGGYADGLNVRRDDGDLGGATEAA